MVKRAAGEARSKLLTAGLLFRRVAVEAPIEATIEFNGRGLCWDVIKVNSHVAARRMSWYRITPRFRFSVWAGEEPLPIEINLRTGHFLKLLSFQILVDNVTVYSEHA